MKNLILATIAVLTLSGAAHAQNNVYVGLRSDDGVKASAGVSMALSGPIQILTYTDIGEYSSLNSEILAIGHLPNTNFYIGAIAGPNVDFGVEANQNPLTYIVGAGGVLAGYKGKSKIGVVGWAKYKFAFEDGLAYVDGWNYGGGLTYGL